MHGTHILQHRPYLEEIPAPSQLLHAFLGHPGSEWPGCPGHQVGVLSFELHSDPFYLVPDEDRSWDSDDLTAQVHLGTSDIPDVLGGVTMEGPCSQVPLLTWVMAFSPRLSALWLAARSWQPLG